MCAVLAGVYVLALLLPAPRRFFDLTVPDGGMIATSVLASAISMGALALCGFTVRVEPAHADGGQRGGDRCLCLATALTSRRCPSTICPLRPARLATERAPVAGVG